MPKQVSELLKFEGLYSFALLVEEGSFRAAAKRLKQTPQALSKMLIQLEDTLQSPLIVRRPWSLTTAGERLYQQAYGVLQRVQQIEQALLPTHSGPWTGELQIGTLGYLDAELWETCQALMQEHEQLGLKLTVYPTLEAVSECLLRGALDIALVPAPLSHPQLIAQAYGNSPMWAVAAPGVSPDISYLRCLAPEPLNFYLELPPGTPSASAEVDLITALAWGVAGAGALWLPYGAIKTHLERGLLQQVRRPAFQYQVPLYLVWAASHDPYPLLLKFLQVLRPHAIPL